MTVVIYYLFLSSLLLSIFLMSVSGWSGYFYLENKNQTELVECGAIPGVSQTPISTRFFTIVMIFLIFDVELMLIMPLCLSMHQNLWLLIAMVMPLLFYFIASLMYEWKVSALEWD